MLDKNGMPVTEVSPVPITYEKIQKGRQRDISIPQTTGLPYRRA